MSLKTLISNTLKDVIDSEVLGELINVYRYTTHASQNHYRQGPRDFDAAVVIRGVVGYNPTKDVLNDIGAGQNEDVRGMITFSRLHLNAAFPGEDPGFAIKREDEVEINTTRYRVVEVLPGAVYGGESECLVVTFMEKP